jgi:hypothetical protein
MKSRTWFAALTLFAALAFPGRPAAQDAGTGTANFIPIWKTNTTLGDSRAFQTISGTLTVVGPNGMATSRGAPQALSVSGGFGYTFSQTTIGSAAGAGGGIQFHAGLGGANGPTFGGSGAVIILGGGTGGRCILTRVGCTPIGGNGGSITMEPGLARSTGGTDGTIFLSGRVSIASGTATVTFNNFEVGQFASTLADAWTTRSSRRFKTNIQPLAGALQKVEQLQGVSYERKADGKHEIGVVAEDVAQVIPEVVSFDPETHEIQGVDYSRLAALLIEAVKSQQADLRLQQAEIQQLKARIERLATNAPAQ